MKRSEIIIRAGASMQLQLSPQEKRTPPLGQHAQEPVRAAPIMNVMKGLWYLLITMDNFYNKIINLASPYICRHVIRLM